MGIFDLSFSRFITPTVIKIVYILFIVVIALALLAAIISGFVADPVAGLLTLVFGPIGAVLYVLLIRVMLEALLAMIRTAENTAELLRIQGGGPAMAAAPGQPYGGPQPPPYGGGQQPYGGQQQPPGGQQPPPGHYPNR